MITEQVEQQNYSNSKYYQFYTVATILKRVIDCFHTIVSDETNPYHPPLSWLTRKQLKPPKDELFHDLYEECSEVNNNKNSKNQDHEETSLFGETVGHSLSLNARYRLEKCSSKLRKDVVSRTKEGCSPFFMACKNGHYNIVMYLLNSCEIDLEQKGRFEALEDHHIHSVTPLWIAAVSGHLSIVKLLIDHRANVNSLSDSGSTPLRSVCFLCRDDEASQSQDDEHESSKDIYFQIVELLIQSGADITKPNFNGGTCLINSIHNYNLTRFIIARGSEVNASDLQAKTALHYAIQQGRLEVTKLLISHGADPMLRTNFCDDALQLSCLFGHVEIFKYLTNEFEYSKKRLADAFKLLGSSILELHYDLTKVRELWKISLDIQASLKIDDNIGSDEMICDTNRSGLPFGDIVEFSTEQELESLSADDFRIQSLLISERILGCRHRETVQRYLYRGTFYINSLQLDRCISLWIYALRLRLQHDSIFHFQSIFVAQALTKLYLDMLSQGQLVKFQDVYEVLDILSNQLSECKLHLSQRPVSRLHEDIFDLLLNIIVNLLFALNHVSTLEVDMQDSRKLIRKLIKIDPRSSNGSSLLHICLAPGLYEGDAHKIISRHNNGKSPTVNLINALLDNGLEVDLANDQGLSALQVLCLTSIRLADKKLIIKRLVDSGAHVDRRSPSPEHREVIRQSLKEAGVNPMQHITLSCLAARKLSESRIKFDESILTKGLKQMIAIH